MGRFVVAGLGLALVIGLTPVQGFAAAAKEWDQEKVTALAEQLAESMKGIRKEYRQEPPKTIGQAQARGWFELRDKLRVIQSETQSLARRLRDGQGHDETVHSYERIQMLRRKTATIARRLHIKDPMMEKIEGAREILKQIAPYYDSNWEAQFGPGRQLERREAPSSE